MIVKKMTLEEKAGLCSGLGSWHTKPVERLKVPSIRMSDGPHGLRKEVKLKDDPKKTQTVKATCFPSGSALASSWDKSLINQVGKALGEECQAEDVSIILGPAVNIKRSPLCGRNFEYYSEDPYLSSRMAANYINGVQSQGVGTSLKHFAANNQECRRMSASSNIDERTLREIYLSSFEYAVKEAKPWTVMCSYNRLNGEYASQNKYLLTDILKNEWKFEGFVMSDWGAVDDRVKGLKAGLELEMPSTNDENTKRIVNAVKTGELDEKVLDGAVERILRIVFKTAENKKKNISYDKKAHHNFARSAAEECMVLLKNEGDILPLKKDANIAVIGEFAEKPRYQGGGSSHITPVKLDTALEEMRKIPKLGVSYAKGYEIETDEIDENLINEAKNTAKDAETTVIFAGLPDRYESEGYDRTSMSIPENQLRLINEICSIQKNVVVVLSNGSPIEMPWIQNVKGVLEAYLTGQASGSAVTDILFGDVNPSGKLAETYPKKLSDTPCYLNYEGEADEVYYGEGVFVGYRYYDKKEIEPLFPFGFGLSYSEFEYSDIKLSSESIKDSENLVVSVKIKNVSGIKGKEVAELYVGAPKGNVIRPVKELKGFEKIELEPHEEKTVKFTLDKRSFAYYDVSIKDWRVLNGTYEIFVGSSSRDIRLKSKVDVLSEVNIKKKYTRNSTVGDILSDPNNKEIGKMLLSKIGMNTESMGTDALGMSWDLVLRAFVSFSGDEFKEADLQNLLNQLNR